MKRIGEISNPKREEKLLYTKCMLSRYGNAFTCAIYYICFVLCNNNDADTKTAVIREKQSIYETIYAKYILM